VRTLAQAKLASFAKLEQGDCKEVYLFQHDQFCGVRFTLGFFQANWRIDETVLTVFRGDHQIDQIDLNATSSNRAA
jgi:hypothetical protein